MGTTVAALASRVANMRRRFRVPRVRVLGAWMLAALLACTHEAIAQPTAATPPAKKRPKIGLVLSGGGARGIAHVGVLQVLDELRIPIDYVAATSMGSIVGGLYASGRTPAEMESILATIDWTTLFSDSPPRRELGFRDKQIDTRFPLPLEIGIRDWQFRGFQGALSGANLELYLHELTAAADGVKDLDRLPIPFRCVATDMVAGTPYVFTEGPLYEAMRASMSIPGIFSPVEARGRLLGDGGLVDNLPIDVVRKMGAEVVIAVNIGTPLAPREQLQSIIGLTGQMINILTEQNVRLQLATLREGDVLISPDLGALTAADFRQTAEFIRLGAAAARDEAPKLASLALSPEAYAAYKAARPALGDTPPPSVEFVRIEGTQYANPEVLALELAVPIGEPLDAKALDAAISRIYGSGEYERIDYHLTRDGERTGLEVDVREKSIGPNYLRFGLNYSTDFQGETNFSLLVGHRRVWLNSLGAQWLNEIEVGRVTRFATELYQPFDLRTTLFGALDASAQNVPRYLFSDSQRVAEYRVQTNNATADLGVPIGRSGEIRVGPTYTFYKASPTIALPGFPTARQTDAGLRALARWDNLDNAFFPRRGVRATLDAFYGQRTQRLGENPDEVSKKLARIDFYANGGIPVSDDDFLNVAGRVGGLSRNDPALVNPFLLGGFLNLSGLRTTQLEGSYLAFGRIVYYHKLAYVPLIGGSVFAGGSIEAGNAWQVRSDISASDLVKAGSLFLAADTFIGPFYFAYGRASGNASSFYLFLGRP
jgi:NTE family protein